MVIAITGIGIVSALGVGQEENRRRLLEAKGGVDKPKHLHTSHHEWPIGEVDKTNEELASMLGLGDVTYTRNILLGLLAIREAMSDSAIHEAEWGGTPLINGSTVGGMDLTEAHYAEWLYGKYETLPLIRQHEVDFSTSEMVRLCGLQSGFTVSTACSSALNAIIKGAELLKNKSAARVVAGGTEAMTLFHLNGFASLGILSKKACRPFRDDRDGINLGEGAAYFVMEDADIALARGAKIYGYLAGFGNSCDAYHQTASSPDGDGAYDAMTHALRMARINPQQIDYINAHGTATPNNDASELRALERVFGCHIPRYESTKPLTGHTTSASGSIEAIFSLFRMEQNGYDYVMSNAFGFGGNDSSIVLSRQPVDLHSGNIQCHRTQVFTCDDNQDYRQYLSPLQARRMTSSIRNLIVLAKKALAEANIERPDAIVVATRFGGMVHTLQLLDNFIANGEQGFSPAQFMNSTHNYAATTLARFLGCKGYNNTVVASSNTLDAAVLDACLALSSFVGLKSILVCSYDEVGGEWSELTDNVRIDIENGVKAMVVWSD